MPIDDSALDVIALSRSEYDLIVERLDREPNEVELGMFGALWSEHCGYKNSKPLLRLLPAEGAYVLTRRGAENAGAIDIGDGLCVVMKIESHNHPSAIEPYEGAATGVGGIVRDIFAMGARPIALLDSLRFGPIAPPQPQPIAPSATPVAQGPSPELARNGGPEPPDPETIARNRYLFRGVVSGIGGYGNCLGIPTVGGEVVFEDAYSGNPLVNAMCVGVAPIEKLASAKAEGVGNVLMLAGADTGRDGIHGASGLASRTDPNARFDELRPAVQVGNPFLEKMLLEACLDLAHNHANWITGIQDLGAAGLTSSAAESAARAGTGLVIDVAKCPRREEGMTPYEVMLSESQERMLIIVREPHVEHVAALFDRWEVPHAVIGHVTGDSTIRIVDKGREVAALPLGILVEAPEYTREGEPSEELFALQNMDLSQIPDVSDANAALLRLLAAPNIASKHWIYRQYDQSVLSNTVVQAGGDAAVLRIKPAEGGSKDAPQKGIALSTDCNGRYCHIDPYIGGAIAVAEAARNVVCVGAQPVAVTDCLNFGNPERPDVYFQMQSVIHGIAEACNILGAPVISGNVSLYNETAGRPVYPTPVIGMLGLLEDVSARMGMAFANAGDEVFVIGSTIDQPPEALGGSEYLKLEHGIVGGRLKLDLPLEARVQRAVLAAIRQGIVTAAHDCSDGGLAVALAEMCLASVAEPFGGRGSGEGRAPGAGGGGLGLDASTAIIGPRVAAALFGETQSRIIVAVRPHAREQLIALTNGLGIPAYRIGAVTAEPHLRLGPIDLPLAAISDAYNDGLERALTS